MSKGFLNLNYGTQINVIQLVRKKKVSEKYRKQKYTEFALPTIENV